MRKNVIGQDETLLAPRDVGKLLGITSSAVLALNIRGRLPALRDSANRRLFRVADIDREVARRAAKTHGGQS
jgi:hypothetical protein